MTCVRYLEKPTGDSAAAASPAPVPTSPSAATHCTQTCVFSHSVPIDPASTADVFFTTNADLLQNVWRKRPLNEERGTPSGCGASLDPDTYKITLEPGTYLIEGSCLHAGTTKSACRLIKLKSDGSYDSTLALGTIGMSRANGNTGNTYFSNGLSTFPPTEVVVTEQTQILVHQFFWNGAAVNGGPANQGGDRPNYGYTTALGTRVSVRRLPDARALDVRGEGGGDRRGGAAHRLGRRLFRDNDSQTQRGLRGYLPLRGDGFVGE